ncbi:MAG: molybdate ABC transporter permease subunit [Cyanobacteria bacterium P01_G01_bin.54]
MDLTPLWLSLRIATIATAIAVVLGVAIAYGMQQYRGRWRSLLDSLLLAPLVLPPTVLGFGLLLLLGKNGPLGQGLDRLGIKLIFTGYAAILTATVVGFPLMYKTTLGAFEQIDPALPSAARTLGASEWRVFWQVSVSLAAPGILAGITLTFARALGEFGATLMLAGNIPGKTQTLPMAIYFAVEAGQFRDAALWTGCIILMTLAGLMLVNTHTRPTPIIAARESPSREGIPVGISPLKQFFRRVGIAHLAKVLRIGRSTELNPESPALTREDPVREGLKPSPTVPSWGSQYLSVQLVKRFPGFTLDIDLNANGSPLGLLGASGAGKSLILRCIAGLETPEAGRIVLNGRVLFDSAVGINLPSRERRVGILFQDYALFPHLSAAENIAFGLPRGLSSSQRRQIVAQQLAAVQLEGLGDRRPHQLSGGQQQRVAWARVLASQPDLLLLDEPFSALDTHLGDRLAGDLQGHLAQFPGVTLLVTHNVGVAYQLCDRLLVIDRGQAVVSGPKKQVLQQPQTVAAARLTGCENISPIVAMDHQTVRVLAWNCTLQFTQPLPAGTTHLGLRAAQIRLKSLAIAADESSDRFDNTFPAWLAMTRETPQRLILYLKLHESPQDPQDYQLQAEVSLEEWQRLKQLPLTWLIHLEATQLLLLRED